MNATIYDSFHLYFRFRILIKRTFLALIKIL